MGKTFTISCESNGRPSPSYTILHNGTKVVSNDKTYSIDVVQYSHAGFYKCIPENKLGIWSMIYNLSVIGDVEYFSYKKLFLQYFILRFMHEIRLLYIIH